jgi:hypothetical protein
VINPAVDNLHDAALEATMYATICSFRTSGVVIAEGLVA